jgi:apolipoprotein N-acyltransferase
MENLAGKVILLWGWRRALVALLAGALAVLAQAPYDFFAVCFVSFPLLVWLLDGAVADPSAGWLRKLAPAFATGWWFGLGYFAAGLWWVGNALLVEAESFAWALPLAVLGLPAILALFYGLAAAMARLAWIDGLGRIASVAVAFGIAEWLRAVLFTGFPWNAIGYAAMPVPLLMQSVALAGLTGMNALAVFVFAMPALLASRQHRAIGFALAALLIAAHVGWGLFRLETGVAAAGQPSIDQSEKWDEAVRDRIFRTYLDLSATPVEAGGERPRVIVWPETALPFLLTERPDALAAIGDLLEDDQILLAGAVRAEAGEGSDARYYNSILAVNGAGEIIDAFDKVHLVPFGEYLPFEDFLMRAGISKIVATPQSFSAGASRRTMALPDGTRILPMICYEIIFPPENPGADEAAGLMLNVTNDAWFGDTPGPYQHFRQAQLHAVEAKLPLVRAANNGISAAVLADGRVVDALGLGARGVLDVSIPLAGDTETGWPGGPLRGAAIMAALALLACGVAVFRSKHRIDTF